MNSITQTTPVSSAPAALPPLTTCTVAVIGLGYVGLPLAVEFAKAQQCVRSGAALNRQVIGFDINAQRLAELREWASPIFVDSGLSSFLVDHTVF